MVAAKTLIWGRMIQKKQQAAKKVMIQPMDSPPASEDTTSQNEAEEVEPTAEKVHPPGMEATVTWEDKD